MSGAAVPAEFHTAYLCEARVTAQVARVFLCAGMIEHDGLMDLDKARDFIRDNHRAVMLTSHADGRPQMSPVIVGLDAEGNAIVSTRETAAKARNLRENPKVTLCVMTDAFFGSWIQVEGTAEIVPLPEAMEALVGYYRDISGEHPDWDDYRATMERERRVILRIGITRAGPDVHG
jgi:PPOX class probable F420-dependent enzyme